MFVLLKLDKLIFDSYWRSGLFDYIRTSNLFYFLVRYKKMIKVR